MTMLISCIKSFFWAMSFLNFVSLASASRAFASLQYKKLQITGKTHYTSGIFYFFCHQTEVLLGLLVQ